MAASELISVKIDSDYSINNTEDFIYADSKDGAIEITLGTPEENVSFVFQDLGYAATNNVTLSSTQLINEEESYVCSSNKDLISFSYDSSTGTWTAEPIDYLSEKVYASFYTTTGGVTAITSAAQVLVIASERVNSNSSVIVLDTNQVTINKSGFFKFSFDCYLNNSSTSRTEYTISAQKKAAGGSYAVISAGLTASYQRGYDSGMSSSYNNILQVNEGDTFRFTVYRTDGAGTTGYQDDNGTRLTIQEL